MSTFTVREIVGRVETVLQDSNVRWPRLELQEWINEAYRMITLHRPDSNTASGTLTCAVGTRQDLTTGFSTAIRLIDITRNMATGSTKKVIRQINRAVLDDQRPGWHAETGTIDIEHFMFDPRLPKEFFVYPPALVTAEIEVIYSAVPSPHALSEANLDPDGADATVISLDDIYEPMIVDWVLYRAYSKDAEYGANEQRAGAAYQAFMTTIGAKTQVDAAADPAVSGRVT